MRFLLETDAGIEDICAAELREAAPGARVETSPWGVGGRLRAAGAEEATLLALRTVRHVVALHADAPMRGLDAAREIAARTEIPEMVGAASFRVTGSRTGNEPFSSQQLARAVGGALQERYGTPVSLERYEVHVRADALPGRLLIGMQRNPEPLDRRVRRPRALRTALKPTIAAAMLRLSGAHRGRGVLADPLCGSGTVLIEARRINPRLELHGFDWDPETLDTARATLAANDVEAELRVADARELGASHAGAFDFIVTDPPYGVRQARRVGMSSLYRSLLPALEATLAPGGRLVTIVVKRAAFAAALQGTGLEVLAERGVRLGELDARILSLERSSA